MTIESIIMKKYEYPSAEKWEEIARRPTADTGSLEKTVRKILEKVRKKGDKAIRKYTRDLDEVSLKSFIQQEKHPCHRTLKEKPNPAIVSDTKRSTLTFPVPWRPQRPGCTLPLPCLRN